MEKFNYIEILARGPMFIELQRLYGSVNDAAKEIVPLFKSHPDVKHIKFYIEDVIIIVFPNYTAKNIVDIYHIQKELAKEKDTQIKNYFDSGCIPMQDKSFKNIVVSSISHFGDIRLHVCPRPSKSPIDLRVAAAEVLSLFKSHPQVGKIYFTYTGVELEITPSYTVEDIYQIYKITMKSEFEKNGQIEEYLANKNTNNAGV